MSPISELYNMKDIVKDMIEIPVWSHLFRDTVSGYGRLFITKPPNWILKDPEMIKYCDQFNHVLEFSRPPIYTLDNFMREVRYKSLITSKRVMMPKPEDIHFHEGFKQKKKDREELRMTIKKTYEENEELRKWFDQQDEAVRALVNHPGPKWWECRRVFQEFNPYET